MKDNNISIKPEINENTIQTYEKELFTMNKRLKDFNSKVTKMSESINNIEIENGISYLDGKNIFMSLYMKSLLEYIQNKVNGKYSEDQVKNLLLLKMFQEKSKVIDLKLSSQLAKHYKIAEEGRVTEEDTLKSNILNLKEEDDDTQVDGKNKKQSSKFKSAEDSKYEANKLYFDFTETGREKKDRQKDLEKAKKKIKSSELYNELLDEIDDRPEEYNPDNTHYGKYMKEVEKYEDDMLTKVYVSKKKIKELKRKDMKDDDLGNFGSEIKNLDKVLNSLNK